MFGVVNLMIKKNTLRYIEFQRHNIWDRVDHILEVREISLKEISRELEISYRTLQNYRSYKTYISTENLQKFCRYLQVEADYLIFGGIDLDREAFHHAISKALEPIVKNLYFDGGEIRVSQTPVEGDLLAESIIVTIAAAARDEYLLTRRKNRTSKIGDYYAPEGEIDVFLADNMFSKTK